MLKKTACSSLVALALILSNNAMCGPTKKLNDGLEGSVVAVARKDQKLAITISLHNAGKNTAYLMLIGPTLATDNSAASYSYEKAGGISVCPWHGNGSQCMGYFYSNPREALSNLTKVDPETSINITFTLFTLSKETHGSVVNFSTVLASRFVSDLLQDKALRDDLKAKEVHQIPLGFYGEPVTEAR
ncbi:MAG: hypothetical protein EKK71_15265 [Candidatus Competibacteraceae bacterium]|nr:MAG: hypothetical protein EKK71_15265 [Candidatus Competibacteraceae bacterium]